MRQDKTRQRQRRTTTTTTTKTTAKTTTKTTNDKYNDKEKYRHLEIMDKAGQNRIRAKKKTRQDKGRKGKAKTRPQYKGRIRYSL